jgi:crotonobetainyl-CoA:carnitine CoA-transferase CaiB-like acyl-CoA transferase
MGRGLRVARLRAIKADIVRQRNHLDVAMADNLFPLMFWAIGQGLVAGSWPGNGEGYLTGGSPRYGLYPTKDGKVAISEVVHYVKGIDEWMKAGGRAAIAAHLGLKPGN